MLPAGGNYKDVNVIKNENMWPSVKVLILYVNRKMQDIKVSNTT